MNGTSTEKVWSGGMIVTKIKYKVVLMKLARKSMKLARKSICSALIKYTFPIFFENTQRSQ
jgi:hypothetical protein